MLIFCEKIGRSMSNDNIVIGRGTRQRNELRDSAKTS